MVIHLRWSTQELGLLHRGLEPCSGRRREAEHGAWSVWRHRDDSFQDAEDHTMRPVLGLCSLFETDATRSTRAGVPWTIRRYRSRSRQEPGRKLRAGPYQPWRSGPDGPMQLGVP